MNQMDELERITNRLKVISKKERDLCDRIAAAVKNDNWDLCHSLYPLLKKNQAEIDVLTKKIDKLRTYILSNLHGETGRSNPIPMLNEPERKISYEEVVSVAFDTNTENAVAKHYQETLKAAQKMINSDQDYWHRIIFLENTMTGELKIWFD